MDRILLLWEHKPESRLCVSKIMSTDVRLATAHGRAKSGTSLAGYPLHRETRENGQRNSLSGKTGILEICQKHRENTGNLVCTSCKFPDSKSRKLAQGKLAVGQGKHGENTGNLKMQFEWVPCIGQRHEFRLERRDGLTYWNRSMKRMSRDVGFKLAQNIEFIIIFLL